MPKSMAPIKALSNEKVKIIREQNMRDVKNSKSNEEWIKNTEQIER